MHFNPVGTTCSTSIKILDRNNVSHCCNNGSWLCLSKAILAISCNLLIFMCFRNRRKVVCNHKILLLLERTAYPHCLIIVLNGFDRSIEGAIRIPPVMVSIRMTWVQLYCLIKVLNGFDRLFECVIRKPPKIISTLNIWGQFYCFIIVLNGSDVLFEFCIRNPPVIVTLRITWVQLYGLAKVLNGSVVLFLEFRYKD